MSITEQDLLTAYRSRLGLTGELPPTLDTLRRLHRAHISIIPFENLELLDGLQPQMDIEFLYEKLFVRRRGGVCFELSFAFLHLLRGLGYDAFQITSCVREAGRMNEHPMILTRLPEGDFLVDVGFVDTALPVLPIIAGPITEAFGQRFRIVQREEYLQLTRQTPEGDWERMYDFSTRPMEVSDYLDQLRWAAAPGNTVFSTYPICSRLYPDCHIYFTRDTAHIRRGGVVTSTRLESSEAVRRFLREHFLPE